MEVYRTACPRDCLDSCAILAYVESEKIVGVKGDPQHPPTGGFLCPKGNSYLEYVYHPERIKYPMIKKNGRFQRVSWDEALDFVVRKIRTAQDQYGPLSIFHNYDSGSEAVLKNLDRRFFNALGGCTGVSGSLCWGGGIAAQSYDFGGLMQNDVEDLENAGGIVLWGRNVTDTNSHAVPFIKKALLRGGKLAVINPIKTGFDNEADIVARPRPGTDAALALGAARYIIKRGLFDEEFIKKYTLGFEEFCRAAEDFTEKKARDITGVDEGIIEKLALFYVQNSPVTTLLGYGLQRYRGGGNTIRAIDALSAITGNIGKSGAGVSYGHQMHWPVGSHIAGMELAREQRYFDRTNLSREILGAKNPPIKVAFITRSNPMNMNPDTAAMKKALNSIETVVAVDLFMTDTVREADIVLPCTSFFEEENIRVNSWSSWIFYCPKIIEPIGESRPDQEIFMDLAHRMGLSGFEGLNTEKLLEWAFKPLEACGINLEQLKKVGYMRNPKIPRVAWEDKKFSTPSGKFEFYSQKAASEGQSPVARYIPPAAEDLAKEPGAYRYFFITPHSRFRIHSQFQNISKLKAFHRKPTVLMHPEEAVSLGLKQGDTVEIYNDRGQIYASLLLEPDMRRDVVAMESGWNIESGACANFLTPCTTTEMGESAAFYDCRVAVRKID
ncbi:MAG: hypothetical protein PWQ97_744 [Tepidanaerobacteraceae bacterium]|nr:hypothetical protein [Tepidanaerobacteraceae bacterium]